MQENEVLSGPGSLSPHYKLGLDEFVRSPLPIKEVCISLPAKKSYTGRNFLDNRIFRSAKVCPSLCHQVKNIKFLMVQGRFRDDLGKVFESFLMSSSQELHSACYFNCLSNHIFLDLRILRRRK